MAQGAVTLAEIWRGDLLESQHDGWAVVAKPDGEVVASWGDPGHIIYPRSSAKMLHQLPLVESGAADAMGLTPAQLALACASHDGAKEHTTMVSEWLAALGLGDDDLRCGPQVPFDEAARHAILCDGGPACQMHNTCSGKHMGYLTASKHMGASLDDYIDPSHPLQKQVLAALEEMSGEDAKAMGIDGCSAPTFAISVAGLAKAMAKMAAPQGLGETRAKAATRLIDAMRENPVMVRGETASDTRMMEATGGRAAVKFGAEGVYTAAIPDLGIGVALKVADGNLRGAEAAIATLLTRLGVAEAEDPRIKDYMTPVLLNRRSLAVGETRPSATLWEDGKALL
ncbi:asparaginase [Paracoccaceae bacterium GXU_MW_L88]